MIALSSWISGKLVVSSKGFNCSIIGSLCWGLLTSCSTIVYDRISSGYWVISVVELYPSLDLLLIYLFAGLVGEVFFPPNKSGGIFLIVFVNLPFKSLGLGSFDVDSLGLLIT